MRWLWRVSFRELGGRMGVGTGTGGGGAAAAWARGLLEAWFL